MRGYKPRRCSKRWLDGDCPAEVLAILDSKSDTDRYMVFYTDASEYDGKMWVNYRAMSADPTAWYGIGISGEMPAHEVAAYRYKFKHQYAKWTDLPDEVKALVRRDCEAIRSEANA